MAGILLFSFLVVLQLKDINCQRLLMLPHLTQHNCARLVVVGICHKRQCCPNSQR
jgi:hypothetical protein